MKPIPAGVSDQCRICKLKIGSLGCIHTLNDQSIPMASLQKESEWEQEFDKRFPEIRIKKEYVDALNEILGTTTGFVPETATEIVIAQNAENTRLRIKAFIRETISQREKEIAEEVENIDINLLDDEYIDVKTFRKKVLSILKH